MERLFEPLTHCPDCGLEAIFKFGRYTTECPCGVHLNINGKVGRLCDECGVRHWSDKAAENCVNYRRWRKNRDLIPTWQEDGTKDERPVYMTGIHWFDIRQAILKRDNKRCTNCHEEMGLAVHHIVPRAWGGTEHPRNLRTLCAGCHVKAHQRLGIWKPVVSRAVKDERQAKLAGPLDDLGGDGART